MYNLMHGALAILKKAVKAETSIDGRVLIVCLNLVVQ